LLAEKKSINYQSDDRKVDHVDHHLEASEIGIC